jgi:hypothetical protein
VSNVWARWSRNRYDRARGALTNSGRPSLTGNRFTISKSAMKVSLTMGARLNQIVELAARNSLPVMGFGCEFPVAGCLISYGASVPDAFRQAGIDGLAIFGLTLAE